jgi:chain length determinant protein (polysaccharide antigen chain regulator)
MTRDQERLVQSNEIDFLDLIQGLWQRKLLMFGTAIVVFLAAVAYVLVSSPVYQAKVFVQPPTQNDIAYLNYGRGNDVGLELFSVKDVYEVFLRHLQSESLRRSFFQTVYLPTLPEAQRKGSQDELYARFGKLLSVSLENKDAPTRFSITANLLSPQQAVDWVASYAQLAGDRAKQEVLKNAKSDALVKANNLQRQISAARESTRKQREDEIVQLKEALLIAKSIGLEKPPIISDSLSTEVSAKMDGSLIYMRGSKALEAEIKNLQDRQSDDPFIASLRVQQSALSFYNDLSIDPALVAVYRQDGVVELPDQPVRPQKLLIVVLGLVLGLILGGIVALMHYLYAQAMHHKRQN